MPRLVVVVVDRLTVASQVHRPSVLVSGRQVSRYRCYLAHISHTARAILRRTVLRAVSSPHPPKRRIARRFRRVEQRQNYTRRWSTARHST